MLGVVLDRRLSFHKHDRAVAMHRPSDTFDICLESTTAMLFSTALQATASRSCSECRTTQLGSFSKHQDDPASPLLRTLHWLLVQQRIDYEVALLTFKVRSTSTPSYLRRPIQDRQHSHNLRSATTTLCQSSTRVVHGLGSVRLGPLQQKY